MIVCKAVTKFNCEIVLICYNNFGLYIICSTDNLSRMSLELYFNPIENVVTTSWFIWYIQGQTYKRKMQSAISIEFQSVSLHIYICTWPHSSFGILKCWRRITFRLSRESVRYHHNWRKRDLILSKKHKTYYHCDL